MKIKKVTESVIEITDLLPEVQELLHTLEKYGEVSLVVKPQNFYKFTVNTNNVATEKLQDLVIDCEWKLRDRIGESFYFILNLG
jgi:hypothetical protein